jgi:hypothetical protein
LERGAVEADAFDSTTGLPLDGATVGFYRGTTLQGSAVITPSTHTDTYNLDPSRVYTRYQSWTDVINLPSGFGCTVKINKTGYTNGYQSAYQHGGCGVYNGWYYWTGRAVVPPKSSNFDVAVGWWRWGGDWGGGFVSPSKWDLDVNVWLPNTPNPLDAGQPAPFIVGLEGNSYGYYEGETDGAMTAFPFARFKRDGGYMDEVPVEDITISSRLAHAPLAANAALPYYPGNYEIIVTDYGQTIDHDANPASPEIPILGVFAEPFIYIWKDGNIKLFNSTGSQDPGDTCNQHNWYAATIYSGISGTPILGAPGNMCGNTGYVPYFGAGFDPATFNFSK